MRLRVDDGRQPSLGRRAAAQDRARRGDGARGLGRRVGNGALSARIFYGWRIVAAGFSIEALVGALMFHAYGAYMVLLREEFGWSKTLLSAAFSMARAESGILGPIQGWLTDRFGPQALIRVGMVIFAGGFMLFSQIGSPPTFFIAFFLIACGSSLGGFLPIGVALVSWFRRRRSLALSLSATGMPVGGLLTPLVVIAMTHLGWRWTAFLSGVLVLLVGLPAAQVVRHRPEFYGEHPDGERPEPAGGERMRSIQGTSVRAAAVDFTPREAVRAPAFWYIALGHGSALLVVSALTVHLVVYITEGLGYSLRQAAAVVAFMTVVQVAAQLAGGWAGDRVSKRAIVVGCMIAHAAGLLLLTFATAFWMVAAFAVLHGTAWGVRGPLMSAIRADYFGAAAFGTITGFSSMIVMFGMMGGPLIAGILADHTGSYEVGFRVLAGLAGLGSIFFVLARRPDPPLRP